MRCARCWSSSPRPSWSRARPATRTATPCSSWRTRRPRTPSRASCGCSTTRAPRSPRPSSARSASMRSAPARAAPTCASRATRRPGSAMPTSMSRWPCATGCSRACSTSPAAKIAKVTIEIPGEEPLVIARDGKDAGKHALAGIPEGKKLKEGAGIDGIVRAVGVDRAGGRAQACGAGTPGGEAWHRQDRGRRRARRHLAAAQGGRGLLARARGQPATARPRRPPTRSPPSAPGLGVQDPRRQGAVDPEAARRLVRGELTARAGVGRLARPPRSMRSERRSARNSTLTPSCGPPNQPMRTICAVRPSLAHLH